MPKMKRKIILPTPEEDAAIRAAIAEDPDTFELDAQWFREAKPLKDVLPDLYEAWYGNSQKPDQPPPSSDTGTPLSGSDSTFATR